MKSRPNKSSDPFVIVKAFLFVGLSLISLLFLLNSNYSSSRATPTSPPNPIIPASSSSSRASLKIRPKYKSYEAYIAHQLNKTLDPRLRHLWATRDWSRKVLVFSSFFSSLRSHRLLSNSSKALCIGARLGQEVLALRSIGVPDSLGIDLVPSPPLVIQADFHRQPFPNDTFDFEFSNVFDHALFPDKFVSEIERTLRPGGVCVLHVAIHRRGDKYSANDLFAVDGAIALFNHSDLVSVTKVDGFGLDTELVMRKKKNKNKTTTTTNV